jgi:hypothetical protein
MKKSGELKWEVFHFVDIGGIDNHLVFGRSSSHIYENIRNPKIFVVN